MQIQLVNNEIFLGLTFHSGADSEAAYRKVSAEILRALVQVIPEIDPSLYSSTYGHWDDMEEEAPFGEGYCFDDDEWAEDEIPPFDDAISYEADDTEALAEEMGLSDIIGGKTADEN